MIALILSLGIPKANFINKSQALKTKINHNPKTIALKILAAIGNTKEIRHLKKGSMKQLLTATQKQSYLSINCSKLTKEKVNITQIGQNVIRNYGNSIKV